jgi:hypothetical protein
MSENQHYGTGRRKTATARVFLRPGTGNIMVNQRPLNEYFGRETSCMVVVSGAGSGRSEGKVRCLRHRQGRRHHRSGRRDPSRYHPGADRIRRKPARPPCAKLASSPATPARWSARKSACAKPAAPPNTPSAKHILGGSSSGRTTDSDSVNLGSNPSPPATSTHLSICQVGFLSPKINRNKLLLEMKQKLNFVFFLKISVAFLLQNAYKFLQRILRCTSLLCTLQHKPRSLIS